MSVGTARKSPENKRIYGAKDFIVPDYVGETLRTFLAQGISLFLLATERIQKYLERINGFRETFIQRGWKYSERHPLRAVPEEDFLHKKINTRDVFVVYGSTVQKNDVFNLWRSDTIELDVEDQHFRNQVLESIIFFWSS